MTKTTTTPTGPTLGELLIRRKQFAERAFRFALDHDDRASHARIARDARTLARHDERIARLITTPDAALQAIKALTERDAPPTPPRKPTRDEYVAHVFATFTASSRKDGRGLVVSVDANTATDLVADARARGLEVLDVVRHDTGRAQARIFSFRRGAAVEGGR